VKASLCKVGCKVAKSQAGALLCTLPAVLQAFLAQLEQQTAALSQEVSKLRLVEQQEMFLNPTAGERGMLTLCRTVAV
jgi:hypothetical protein